MDRRTENLPILQDFVPCGDRCPKTKRMRKLEREREGSQRGEKMFRVTHQKEEPVAKRHHMVSGTLAPLYTVFGVKLGCSGAAAPIGDEVL